jgi:hypothetical protein
MMPLYVYEPVEGDCKICRNRLEIRRPADRPALEKCPLCRKPVRQIFETFNTPKVTKPVSVADAKKAGFSVFKKIGSGEYERQ